MRSHLWYKTIDQVKAYVGNQCALLNLFPSNFPPRDECLPGLDEDFFLLHFFVVVISASF